MSFPEGAANPKHGLSISAGLPSVGLGYGGYAEVAATNIKPIIIDGFIDETYKVAIEAVDMAITGTWKSGPLGWLKLGELY